MPLGEQMEEAVAIESVPTRDKAGFLFNAHPAHMSPLLASHLPCMQVIRLINEAQMVSKDKKLSCLNQVRTATVQCVLNMIPLKNRVTQIKELIINNEPDLLDSFLDVSQLLASSNIHQLS